MALSTADTLRQNTEGYSEGSPLGVPSSYSWYSGVSQANAAPPRGFTSVLGWGQVYQDAEEPLRVNAEANVEVADAQTYVHVRATGDWIQVQDQSNNPIVGGHFVTDFAGNAAQAMPVNTRADGTAEFDAPPTGYNDHFWSTSRGTFSADAVDAVYVQMDMRVTDPNVNLIANVGADWWRDASAPYVDGFSNNPGAGMSNWVDLSTEWTTLAYTSSTALLQADPPPPIEASAAPMLPPPSQPVSGPTVPPVLAPTNDTLVFEVSADSYQGNPHFVVMVDGRQVGGTFTTGASHAAGQTQDITLTGAFGPGAHEVAVRFLDDAWRGTTATDRNLYVHEVTFNGTVYSGDTATNTAGFNTNGVAALYWNGSAEWLI